MTSLQRKTKRGSGHFFNIYNYNYNNGGNNINDNLNCSNNYNNKKLIRPLVSHKDFFLFFSFFFKDLEAEVCSTLHLYGLICR